MRDFLSIATSIEILTSKCYFCGLEAEYTITSEDKDRLIDTKNIYVPVCKYCLKLLEKYPKKFKKHNLYEEHNEHVV